MRIFLTLALLLAENALADTVTVNWTNPTGCTVAGAGAYTHLGTNVLVNGTLRAFVTGTTYGATLNNRDVVSATACGYCGSPPANGGAWSAPGRCAAGNESTASNAVTYTSTAPPQGTSNSSLPAAPVIALGGTAPPPTQTESDTFTSIGSSWVTLSSMSGMTASNGNVQCPSANIDCGIIRNTSWPANQMSTITIAAITTNDEVGAFVRTTTSNLGILCTQNQGGNASILERVGNSWNVLASVPGTPLAPGGTLSCSAVGNQFTLKVNGVTLLQTTNGAHPTGAPGVEVYDAGSVSARISDWRGDAL